MVKGLKGSIYSDVFHVGGCSWRIVFNPCQWIRMSHPHVSVYLALVGGRSEAMATFTLFLQDYRRVTHEIIKKKNALFNSANDEWGKPGFMRQSELEEFLHCDCILIGCTLSVFQPPKNHGLHSIGFPLPDITPYLLHLLEIGKGADVNFDVNGERFSAHKLILASRSSVFDVLFFGSLKDEVHEPIQVKGMEPKVFKTLLHFIYCDELLDLNEILQLDSKSQTMMHELLIDAANQYDLESLKLLCSTHLWRNMSAKNLVTTWALADRYHCFWLKTRCLDFVDSFNSFQDVIQIIDFEGIKKVIHQWLKLFCGVFLLGGMELKWK